jgi:predicted nucleic acid-binding protein
MARVLLDTTVVIDALRGRAAAGRVRALRRQGDQPYVCAITVEETVRGLRPVEEPDARQLFAGVRTVPLGEPEGWQAGEWRRAFAQRGRTLSQPDCLIAAAALAAGARLATGNPQDFPMEELTVEHWPVGQMADR